MTAQPSSHPDVQMKLASLPIAQAIERAAHLLTPPDATNAAEYPVAALGPLADAARDLAAGAQVDVAMAAQSLLAAAALLTQSTAMVRSLDGAPKPLSVFAITIANSGDGKDAADRVALAPVHAWQRRAGKEYTLQLAKSAAEKKKENETGRPRDVAPYRLCQDATAEGLRRSFSEGIPSQGLFSTEAGAVLQGHGMTAENRTKTAAVLCSLWDKGHLSVLRAGTGRTELYGLRLSAHLMLQPAALGDVLTDPMLSGIGFWPRFLLAWPAPLRPRVYRPWRAESVPSIQIYQNRAHQLLSRVMSSDCDELPIIELRPDALGVMAQFFNRMEVEARRGQLKDVRPFALRATEMACRVAGVLAAWAGKDHVDADTAQGSMALATYAIGAWQAALGGKADPVAAWALITYRWLVEQREPVRLRNFTKLAPGDIRPAARRDAALDRLQSLGLLVVANGHAHVVGVAT